jgi:hypothetical protein
MTPEQDAEIRKQVMFHLISFMGVFERVLLSEKHGMTLPEKLAVMRKAYAKTYRDEFGEEPPDTSGSVDDWPDLLM